MNIRKAELGFGIWDLGSAISNRRKITILTLTKFFVKVIQ